MNSTGWVGVIVAILIIIGGAWVVASGGFPPTDTTNENIPAAQPGTDSGTDEGMPDTGTIGAGASAGAGVSVAPLAATVTYSASGFSPATVTIKKGGTVTWKNQSGGNMWVASANHPTHTVYDGTSRAEHCSAPTATTFDQCKGGGDYSFAFTQAGTWNYHDHINASHFGKVIVTE